VVTCSRCGQENPDGARFCNGCAAALAADEEGPLEERKVVTILFADLVGFTSRAERMDPEEVRSLLRPYHARLRDELERFGGTVEKFIGDAVMAVFGAPVSHEDDAERAVRAALAIRDWFVGEQVELQLRIGVNTGPALVSLGTRPEEGEGMVAGDVVNTAARLQSSAPVNGILVGGTTWRATRDAIDYRQVEAVHAKGKAEPLDAWEALDARGRVGVDISAGTRTPLVGRRRELDAVLDTFERARSTRSAQLVTLVGEPGIGKSRLVYELFQAVERDPELVYWRQGRSLPYGEGVSFWALGEIFKAQAGILETDSEDEAERKLRDSVAATMAAGEIEWTLGHLRPLVGVEEASSRGDSRGEAFAAWRGFLEAVADTSPLVLVFEDLHWADEGLLDFVDHLVDWATRVPMLVVATARPELLTPAHRVGWRQDERHDAVPRAAHTHRDCGARARAARAFRDPRGRPGHVARARGRQPALRRGVRPPVRGARGARHPSRDRPGHYRRASRRARAWRQGAAPGCGGARPGVLGGCAGARPRHGRRRAAPARATGVRPARAEEHGGRRDRVRLPPCPPARGRLRADPTRAARSQAPTDRRLAGDARPVG
jgi:class 3 adenylate cyclase